MSKHIHDFTEVVGTRVYRVRLIQELPGDVDEEHFYREHEFELFSLTSSDKVSGSIWESKHKERRHCWSFSLNSNSLFVSTLKFVADIAEIIERLRVRLGLENVEESGND